MAELKPCPFCGREAKIKYGKYNLLGAYGTPNEERQWWGVFCKGCGVGQPKRKFSVRENAIAAWNWRVDNG